MLMAQPTERGAKPVRYADISRIIDTSTVAGRLLADKLGEDNYTDADHNPRADEDYLCRV